MSDTTLQVNKTKDRNDEENASTGDTITLDMEVTESDEIQRENSETTSPEEIKVQLNSNEDEYLNDIILQKEKHVGVGNDFIVPCKYMQQDRPLYQNVTWVQFMGGNSVVPYGAPLDYSPDRNRFVLIVFSIVFIMLLVTAGFNLVVLLTPDVRKIFRNFGLYIIIAPMLIMIGMSYAMACLQCTRRFPCNVICLTIAVLCMSLITAYFTSKYKTSTVLYALLATVLVVIVCMGLACSSFDFTRYMLFVIVIAAAFSGIALVAGLGMLISGTYIKPLHLGLLIVGTLIQVILLTMELQTILGGRTVELGEDDYALGAYMLYTSIIDIFIKFVQMIGMFEN